MSKKCISFSLAVFFCVCNVLIIGPSVFAVTQQEYWRELGKQTEQVIQLFQSCKENCSNALASCRTAPCKTYNPRSSCGYVCDQSFSGCMDECRSKYHSCLIPGMFAPRGELPYATQEGCEWRRAN